MKGLKKLLAMVLSLAMVMTMVSFTALAEDTPEETVTEEGVTCNLGMFGIYESTVTVNDNATVSVNIKAGRKFDSRYYPKIALVAQSATDEEKDAAAINGTTVKNDSGKYETEYNFTIPVTDLGKTYDISFYQVRDDADEDGMVEVTDTTTQEKKKVKGSDVWYNWGKQYSLTVNNTSDVVDQLISKIYVQTRNDYTDTMCAQAKASWDALTDAQKEQVEEYDYFGVDTGDGSKDDPLNQDGIGEKELLVVSFGTSFNGSRVATIGAIEKALQEAYPEYSVRRAFTAQIIINHIQAREGYKIDNVDEAIQRAIDNGVKELVVQPTHLMTGAEYDEMKGQIDAYADKFEKITYSYPLCKTVADKKSVIEAVTAQAASDANMTIADLSKDNADTAFVFMGHGTSHEANVTYAQMQDLMTEKGLKNCFVGTVEGKPESTELSVVLNKIKEAGYTKVILRPLMVVAGDHANNDMAGDDEDSWKSAFEAAGFEVTTEINGLGEIEAIQQMYVEHTANAINGVTVDEELEDGIYTLDVTSDNNMFNIASVDQNTCEYVVKDGKGTVTIRLNGTSYSKLYIGTRAFAVEASDENCVLPVVDEENYYTYTFELDDLGPVNIARYSTKSNAWVATDVVLTFSNPVRNTTASKIKAELDAAETEVETAKAEAEAAKAEADASKAEVEAKNAELEAAKAELAKAQAEYTNYVAKHKVIDNAVKSVKAKAGSNHTVTVSYKKFAGAEGYEVYRSLKSGKGFKKVATVKNVKTLKTVVKGQKKGKTYYFKVRAYAKVDGKTCYSQYSTVVKVKAK